MLISLRFLPDVPVMSAYATKKYRSLVGAESPPDHCTLQVLRSPGCHARNVMHLALAIDSCCEFRQIFTIHNDAVDINIVFPLQREQ